MPIYQLKCELCQKSYEYLVVSKEKIQEELCKNCDSTQLSIDWTDNAPALFKWSKGGFSASSEGKGKK